ncbi:RNA-binding protein 8A [Gossypium australe]|uniref:RNA-binding protein 8A n=1 Tax=Gossypium australe TaxID=47621 RepID=A0A5B6W6L6_9ROSI|nr:RNA-binding protein 8A [Gossypium australe]
MDPRKAPGIDSLSDGNKDISYLNDAMIVLIPNIKDPNDMTNFRPISLCRSSRNGPNKGFVIKLDMSKPYDRVDWNFLKKAMKNLGFEDV